MLKGLTPTLDQDMLLTKKAFCIFQCWSEGHRLKENLIYFWEDEEGNSTSCEILVFYFIYQIEVLTSSNYGGCLKYSTMYGESKFNVQCEVGIVRFFSKVKIQEMFMLNKWRFYFSTRSCTPCPWAVHHTLLNQLILFRLFTWLLRFKFSLTF